MRSIGRIADEQLASTFGEVLEGYGISNSVQRGSDGGWEVWIASEDQLEQARALMLRYLSEPHHPDFAGAVQQAGAGRKARQQQKRDRHRVIDRKRIWPRMDRSSFGYLTIGLIVISVAVSLVSKLGDDHSRLGMLFITNYEVQGGFVRWFPGLPEVLSGQVWRLITPIFIHFGVLHLLFNMLWLKDLGSMIERAHSPWVLGAMVVVMGAVPNLAQYLMSGPSFGGMSGVVYGLLGYIWMRGRLDPGGGLSLHRSTVIMMLIWFVACWTGVLGPIANWAHTGGLVVGVAWGFLSARLARARR